MRKILLKSRAVKPLPPMRVRVTNGPLHRSQGHTIFGAYVPATRTAFIPKPTDPRLLRTVVHEPIHHWQVAHGIPLSEGQVDQLASLIVETIRVSLTK